jgi:uncharacterized repeat protein (TIGR03806 family)
MQRTAWILLFIVAACSGSDDDEQPEVTAAESLAALELFDDVVAQTPSRGVVPYDVNSVLYADESEKLRFISVPEGKTADYDAMGQWSFPDGTKLIKTFFYYNDLREPTAGRRLLETRIVERAAGRWTGRTYIWNDEQTEARRYKVGRTLNVTWVDANGEMQAQPYRVPNDNECKTCHSKDHQFEPLGPRTRQLNREHHYASGAANQIDHFAELGWLKGVDEEPDARYTLAEPYGDAPLERRARAYLDANCSHCHRPGGEAGSTALDLRAETTDAYSLGNCRSPVAAGPGSGGRRYDIVAGKPDASIMVFRMESTDPQLKMPELPTLTSDAKGTALIREWIAAMDPERGCD